MDILRSAMAQRIGDSFWSDTLQVVAHLASHRVKVTVYVKFAHQTVDF